MHYYQVLYGTKTSCFHEIIACKDDDEAKRVAMCIYLGWAANHTSGICLIKRGYGFDISQSNYDILVHDCI